MRVDLEEITPLAEQKIIRIARVSSPKNQDNPEIAKLLTFCVRNGHWSIFEHAHMTVYIETSLAIATQILRHRSFTFQQFSQRYADANQLGFEPIEWRKQAEKNRQSSSGMVDPSLIQDFNDAWFGMLEEIQNLYDEMVSFGVAKECARFILPQCTTTRLYMTGNIRSWIHYLGLRTEENVQLEHRQVAREIKKIFVREFPIISLALGWTVEESINA